MTYEKDEYLWRKEMISLLESGKLGEIDAVNLMVVLAEMGKSEQRSVRSALTELILHLLKAMYQPEKATRSWYVSVLKQRQALSDAFEDSPSLVNVAKSNFQRCYKDGRRFAIEETGLDSKDIPVEPEFDFDYTMNEMPYSLKYLKK